MMSERSIHIKIPVRRVGVLIGSDGNIKKTIENQLRMKIDINSKTGDVKLSSVEHDPSYLFIAKDIVFAIGRGFSPERALKLLNEDVHLYAIDLREIFRSPSDIQRIKSRIIGKKGKTRRIIEEDTKTYLSIYGHTISIIGDIEHLDVAKEAVEMLMGGVLHRNVYRYLDRKRVKLREIERELWKKSKLEFLKKE